MSAEDQRLMKALGDRAKATAAHFTPQQVNVTLSPDQLPTLPASVSNLLPHFPSPGTLSPIFATHFPGIVLVC